VVESTKNHLYEFDKIIYFAGSVQKTCTLRASSAVIAGEPEGPTVKTDIPGPKSKQLLNELSAIQVSYDSNFISSHHGVLD
jgi:hypothetical protein